MKKIALVLTVIFAVSAVSLSALAVSAYKTPAEIVAGLTERTTESVTEEKTESDKTYGTIASEAGVLDEFKTQMLEQKKAYLAEKVADGTITQEKADELIAAMEENQADCDGTGTGRQGNGVLAGNGLRLGEGNGMGANGQKGSGQRGNGTCTGDGTCTGTGTGAGTGLGRGNRGAGRGTCTAGN